MTDNVVNFPKSPYALMAAYKNKFGGVTRESVRTAMAAAQYWFSCDEVFVAIDRNSGTLFVQPNLGFFQKIRFWFGKQRTHVAGTKVWKYDEWLSFLRQQCRCNVIVVADIRSVS